ncbi:hypothetical protein HDK90DRAFT_473504 [Phyllosticta capitalensis]|uniref:Secreted protein n=1 Tax=Phyllosticta capitalensis TaxID=121624 RepID=A0ABR1Z3Y0_9PEZI
MIFFVAPLRFCSLWCCCCCLFRVSSIFPSPGFIFLLLLPHPVPSPRFVSLTLDGSSATATREVAAAAHLELLLLHPRPLPSLRLFLFPTLAGRSIIAAREILAATHPCGRRLPMSCVATSSKKPDVSVVQAPHNHHIPLASLSSPRSSSCFSTTCLLCLPSNLLYWQSSSTLCSNFAALSRVLSMALSREPLSCASCRSSVYPPPATSLIVFMPTNMPGTEDGGGSRPFAISQLSASYPQLREAAIRYFPCSSPFLAPSLLCFLVEARGPAWRTSTDRFFRCCCCFRFRPGPACPFGLRSSTRSMVELFPCLLLR